MKNYIYILLGLCLALFSCSPKNEKSDLKKAEKTTIRFGIDLPNFAIRSLEQQNEDKIETLELWVFDQDGHFVEKSKAVLESGTTYEAAISPSSEPRIIHFAANCKMMEENKWVGKNEAEVLTTIPANSDGTFIPMWARIKVNDVKKNDLLGNISLLRSMVKFSLSVSASNLRDVTYSLYNTLDKGTLSPFNPNAANNDAAFDRSLRIPTEPAGAVFQNDKAFQAADGSHFFYAYERKNGDEKTPISCFILKAKYKSDAEYSYYKIDFVDHNDKTKRYDLIRNHYFKVGVSEVRARGYKSIEEALNGVAANNLSLSENFQVFPNFSDGKGLLTVDKTSITFLNNEAEGKIIANYYPDKNSDTKANERITVQHSGDAIRSVSKASDGRITMELYPQPAAGEGILLSDLIVGVSDNPDLKRLIRVVVRRHYDYASFRANGRDDLNRVRVQRSQDSPLTVEISLPEDFPDTQLPFRFRFFTDNFYPSAEQGFIFKRINDKTCYEYTVLRPLAPDKKIVCYFKSNKANSAETILVQTAESLFDDKELRIVNY